MPKERKVRLKEYREKKAKGLERIRQSAQSAFMRAQEEKSNGNIPEATRWMDRAHRLAAHNPNITFDLVMLKLKQQQYDDAYALLVPLMKKFDFFEGWLVLAIVLAQQEQFAQAIEYLHHALSHYCPTQQTWETIRGIIRRGDEEGCCALIGSLGQVWIDNKKQQLLSVFLDDQLILETTDPFFTLPSGWQDFAYLYIETAEQSLVGSPIDIQEINCIEGFVESNDDHVNGWLWYPAEPDRVATVTIYDQEGRVDQQLQAAQDFQVATLEFPLFRAKQFIVPLEQFLSGLYDFKDDFGRSLVGSPIDPLLLQKKKARFKNIVKKHQHYMPISAYYKGDSPVISEHVGAGVVIIIPVYKGKEETQACIKTVLQTLPHGYKVQLVNDCSPDGELIEWLETQINHENIFLIHHLENLGFPGAVNTGMLAWPGYDYILLNSDTLVAKGWAENLLDAAYSAENIGTVVPFSNDASIFSYPYCDKENPVPSLKSVQNLMQYMQKAHKNVIVDVPTSHGFCMFIRHDCLSQTGFFRENLFAQGYGEENDFCMRAQHLGWRHVLAAGVFVGHKGGVSFQNSKQSLLKRNIAILNKLYPDYDIMIMDYMDRDFLRFVRRKVDLLRLQLLEKKQTKLGKSLQYALFITHDYGGGVERAVQEQANQFRLKEVTPLFIRPTLLGDGCKVEIQLKSPSSEQVDIEGIYPNFVFDLPSEYTDLLDFLNHRVITNMQVHHFTGHHSIIHNLLHDLEIEYSFYLHDYMSFCPRISLINKKEAYCGEPKSLDVCQKCIGQEFIEEDEPVQIQQWVERSYQELKNAVVVIVPSEDTANRISQHFSKLKGIKIQYLEDDLPDLSLTQLAYFSRLTNGDQEKQIEPVSPRYRVCFIGAIGIEKGFNIVQALVKDADKRNLPLEFVLVGRSVDDRLFVNTDRLFITGSYTEEEAVNLVMQQNADIAFFPAIWPETWCYALSIAWRSGLQTVAYDIGAIAQRIQKTQRGWILSPSMAIPKQNDMLLSLCQNVRKE